MEALASLPLVLAVVLLELAVGGAFVLWFLDRTGVAPIGFLKLTAFVNLAAIGFGALLLPALPRGDLAAAAGIDAGALASFSQAVMVVLVLAVVHVAAVFTPWTRVRNIVALVLTIAGTITLIIAATARPTQAPYDVFALLALPLGALALGGSNAAMLLGHWYLVTPKLSPGPLQRAALIVVGAVALQTLIVFATFARGELATVTETAMIIAIAIRVGVGLALTAGVALAAWWTAKTNTQSSTGLLYVGIGTALAGEVSARVIFYLTGAAF